MSVRLLRANDLALACPMTDAIDAVAAGFVALSAGQTTAPVRLSIPINEEGVALTMPASLIGASCYSVKVVSVAPANRSAGRPLVTGTILLIDASNGDLVALIDGTALTALRTGAAGGVAARALSRPDAERAALLDSQLTPLGASLGARTLFVLPARVCGIAETARLARYLASESAGQCGPCVHGLDAIAGGLEQLARPERADHSRLERWLEQVRGRGACRHPDGAVRLVASALDVFAREVELHAAGRCSGDGQVVLPTGTAR